METRRVPYKIDAATNTLLAAVLPAQTARDLR
jgi:hypothetical protein